MNKTKIFIGVFVFIVLISFASLIIAKAVKAATAGDEFVFYDATNLGTVALTTIDYPLGGILSLAVNMPSSFKDKNEDIYLGLYLPDNTIPNLFLVKSGETSFEWKNDMAPFLDQKWTWEDGKNQYFLGNFSFSFLDDTYLNKELSLKIANLDPDSNNIRQAALKIKVVDKSTK